MAVFVIWFYIEELIVVFYIPFCELTCDVINDDVDNISRIRNTAGYVNTDLGGNYDYSYKYDDIYRLVNSTGSFAEKNNNLAYSLDMSYSNSGNISNKTLSATTIDNGSLGSKNYNNSYSYYSNSHKVQSIYDGYYTSNFNWDANGNMTYYSKFDNGSDFVTTSFNQWNSSQ